MMASKSLMRRIISATGLCVMHFYFSCIAIQNSMMLGQPSLFFETLARVLTFPILPLYNKYSVLFSVDLIIHAIAINSMFIVGILVFVDSSLSKKRKVKRS